MAAPHRNDLYRILPALANTPPLAPIETATSENEPREISRYANAIRPSTDCWIPYDDPFMSKVSVPGDQYGYVDGNEI